MRKATWKVLLATAAIAVTSQTVNAQETRLLLTSLSPAGSPNSQFFNAWAQKVTGASQGTLKIEVRDGATLANFGNTYDRTLDDVVQIGWTQHPFVAGKFPLSEVTNLPFMSDDTVSCSVALWRLYKSGVVDGEYKEVVPVWFGCLGQSGLHFNKALRSNDDLGGMKLRVAGKVPSQLVERLGGTPISMAAENMYESLQRNTIDGAVTSWSAFEPYKLAEVTSYHLEVPVGSTPSMFFMSRKKFDSLPAAARKAIEDNGGEAQTRAFGVHITAQGARARQPVASSDKHKIVSLNAAQTKLWEDKIATIRSQWASERAGGDKVIETYRSLYAQLKAGR